MHQRRFVIAEEEGDPVVCYADYEDMQKSYGNNFCVILDRMSQTITFALAVKRL